MCTPDACMKNNPIECIEPVRCPKCKALTTCKKMFCVEDDLEDYEQATYACSSCTPR